MMTFDAIKKRYTHVTSLLSISVMLVFISGLLLGTIPISFSELFHFFATKHTEESHFIITLRFNRELLAICCGGMLAIGSAILQTLTRNPMIAPDLTGMTSIGCLFVIVSTIINFKFTLMRELLGILGAISGFLLCFMLAKTRGQKNSERIAMVLTGLIISFTATALTQLFILHAPHNTDDYFYFLTGSLYAITNETTLMVLVSCIVLVPISLLFSKYLMVFLLDDQTCISLGVPVKRYWLMSLFLSSLLIGSSLVGIGNMGFLGIVSPNLARQMVGDRPIYVLPLSFLIGSLIYLFADILGRLIISPAEISAGLMTNMITAPLFLVVLFQFYRGQHEWH